MNLPKPHPPHLFLRVDREIVTSIAGGDREIVPPVIRDAVGASLLDFVHPVDRTEVNDWLMSGLGASPPFRRAAADDPPRWFRFVAAASSPGRMQGEMLLLDVTRQVRERALRQRMNSVLARYVGWALVERAPALAAELAGSSHGCLMELHPPVSIVRARYGEGMPSPGSTLPISDSPVEVAAVSRSVKVYRSGLAEAFPEWPLIRMVGADSAVVIPILDPMSAETRAVLTCCASTPIELREAEEELLDLLAVRLASEFKAREESGEHAPVAAPAELADPAEALRGTVTGMMLRGLIHTLNNLFAAQSLNLELLRARLGENGRVAAHLERVEDGVRRGAGIVAKLRSFEEGVEERWADFELAEVAARAVELVRTLHGACKLELDAGSQELVLWCEETTLLGLMVSLLEPAALLAAEGGRVGVSLGRIGEEGADGSRASVRITAQGSPAAGMDDAEEQAARRLLDRGIDLASRFVDRLGGRLAVERNQGSLAIEITLPVLRPGSL